VNEKNHFTVPRKALVKACMENLIGDPEEGGHYFTVWAPRQAGKTWLVRRVVQEIETLFSNRFAIGQMSCQGIVMEPDGPEENFLKKIPKLMLDGFDMDVEAPAAWEEWTLFFHKRKGLFKKPVILLIDEFDSLPPAVIDRIVAIFRDVYLNRDDYCVHGLALIGVRAVLGVESERGSPFNIQRSLHVPNFTPQEVAELFRQYQEESGQAVAPEVVEQVFETTRGQPGLVGWFGELLTETYNPGPSNPIDLPTWQDVYEVACFREWNNTILNLVKKARGPHVRRVLDLFEKSDLPFSIYAEWCNYLYLNGIIREKVETDQTGRKRYVCQFSSPFVQTCLFHALTLDLVGDRFPVLPLEPLDALTDVFDKPELDLTALLDRYKKYLERLKARGVDPWREQPRRSDLHLTEAVGHFHLYAWLKTVLEDFCVVSPEFPTGNGRVDLLMRCEGKQGVVEVKSYQSQSKLEKAKIQAAGYAQKLNLPAIALALFAPVDDETVLDQLSGESLVDGVRVMVTAVGWVTVVDLCDNSGIISPRQGGAVRSFFRF